MKEGREEGVPIVKVSEKEERKINVKEERERSYAD